MLVATLDVRLRRQSDTCQSATCLNGAICEPGKAYQFQCYCVYGICALHLLEKHVHYANDAYPPSSACSVSLFKINNTGTW